MYAGHRPIRPSAMRKENGELTRSPDKMLRWWQQHFSKLLNQQVQLNEEVLQHRQMIPLCLDLDEPHTEEELEAALSGMKRGEAAEDWHPT